MPGFGNVSSPLTLLAKRVSNSVIIVNSRVGRAGLFVVRVAALALLAGCSEEPNRTDIRITALESNINRMERDMEGLRLKISENDLTIFRLTNQNNKAAPSPVGNPASPPTTAKNQ